MRSLKMDTLAEYSELLRAFYYLEIEIPSCLTLEQMLVKKLNLIEIADLLLVLRNVEDSLGKNLSGILW